MFIKNVPNSLYVQQSLKVQSHRTWFGRHQECWYLHILYVYITDGWPYVHTGRENHIASITTRGSAQ